MGARRGFLAWTEGVGRAHDGDTMGAVWIDRAAVAAYTLRYGRRGRRLLLGKGKRGAAKGRLAFNAYPMERGALGW